MRAAKVAVAGSSCLVSSCRMSHFGMKPVRGGRPPNESKMRGVRDVRAGALAQEIARALMLVDLLSLNTRNVENVMMRYVKRARRVREGENCKMRIIQPRWAMDE